jgi:hypothetical protein
MADASSTNSADALKKMVLFSEALKKLVAALKRVRYQAVAVGDAAHRASGSDRDVSGLDFLTSTNEKQRAAIIAAAQKEGMTSGEEKEGQIRLNYKGVPIRLVEAVSAFQRQVLARAVPGVVLGVRSFVATPEDLILMRAGSDSPGHRESVMALMKAHAGKLDPDYLKAQAEAAGIFDKVKALWKESKPA